MRPPSFSKRDYVKKALVLAAVVASAVATHAQAIT
jgi:hypothetical protein